MCVALAPGRSRLRKVDFPPILTGWEVPGNDFVQTVAGSWITSLGCEREPRALAEEGQRVLVDDLADGRLVVTSGTHLEHEFRDRQGVAMTPVTQPS